MLNKISVFCIVYIICGLMILWVVVYYINIFYGLF